MHKIYVQIKCFMLDTSAEILPFPVMEIAESDGEGQE